MPTIIEYYTDGACSPNPGVGGYAWIRVEENAVMNSGGGYSPKSTNQIMELKAIREACDEAERNGFIKPFSSIHIYTDSAYAYNCWKQQWYRTWQSNGWRNSKKEPVANKDLWEQLIPFFENPAITFHKVSGHTGNYYNEMVDDLAVWHRNKMRGYRGECPC